VPPAVVLPSVTTPAVRPLLDVPPLAGTPPAPAAMRPAMPGPRVTVVPPPASVPAAPPVLAAEPSAPPRFALVYGPLTAAEAEQIERVLIRAGHDTVRRRQEAAPTVYAVLIERVPTEHDARAVIAALREQGIGEARIVAGDPLVLRVGELRPLRGAVELAERVRRAGYHVRVAAQRGDGRAYVVRHGTFATRDAAEARGRELARLRVPAAQVVQVR
jgi:hypothetical protein